MVLRNKKVLKLVVCISLIAALAISAICLTAGAVYENTHYNTGDQAQDMVGIAQTQVGYSEGDGGYTKYGDWYGMPNADWCAMFVSWCANQAGVDTGTFQPFALCSAGADWFIANGNFHYSGSYTPQAGDLIFYSSYGNIYHVGLVTGSDGYNVYSIEGNYNEMVSNVSYSLSYGDILGYATPNYSTSNGGDTVVSDVDTDSDVYTDSYDYTDSDIYTDSDEYTDSDIYTDSDVYTDSDEDTDSDIYTDSDVYTDSDEDTDSDIYTDSDVYTDSDTETDESTDTDTDDIQHMIGDVNGDGRVSVVDALIVRRYLCGLTDLTDTQKLLADIDGSGDFNMTDVILIMDKALG